MSKPEILVTDTSADPTSIILPLQEEVTPLTHPDNLATPAQLTPEEHDRAKEQFAEIAGRVASAQTVLAERSVDGKIRTRFSWDAYNNIDKATINQVVQDARARKIETHDAAPAAVAEPLFGTPEVKPPVTTFETIGDVNRETDLEGMHVPDITTLHAARKAFKSIETRTDDDGAETYFYDGKQISLPILTRLKLDRNTQEKTWVLEEIDRERYILASQATSEEDFIAEDKADFENFKSTTGLEGDQLLEEFKQHRISRVNLSDVITRRAADENTASDDVAPVGKELVVYEAFEKQIVVPEKPNRRRRIIAGLVAGALALGGLFGAVKLAEHAENARGAAGVEQVEETVEKSQPATDGLGETTSLEDIAAQQAEAEAQAQAETEAAAAAEAEANRHPLEAQEVRTVAIGGRGVWGAAEQFLAAHNLPVTNEYVNILMWDHLNWALEQARAQGQDVPATAAEFVNSGADHFMRQYGATFPLDSVKKIEELSGVKAS